MLLLTTNIELVQSNVHCYSKFFPGVVEYDLFGNNVVACHRLVTEDVPHHFIVTIYKTPYFKIILTQFLAIILNP